MGHSDLDPAAHERHPWNAGQNVGPKRPLRRRDIWTIRFYLDEHQRYRDRVLFDLAIDSKLRSCDLVKLRIAVRGAAIDAILHAPEHAARLLDQQEKPFSSVSL